MTSSPRQKKRKPEIINLVEKHCEIDTRGFGKIMEIFSPDYPEDLPASSNGYGAFKHDSPLAKSYIIRKFYANGTVQIVNNGRHVQGNTKDLDGKLKTYGKTGRTLIAWQIYGFAPETGQRKNAIPKNVYKALAGKPCVFMPLNLDTEVDHKYGRDDQNCYPTGEDLKNPDNYQTATKAANNTKREFCKRCKQTDNRYDARQLGFLKGWTLGGERFEGTREGCHGCYLFDPVEFRRVISGGGKKQKSR